MKDTQKISRFTMAGMLLMLLWAFITPMVASGQPCPADPHNTIVMDTVTLNTGVTLQYAECGNENGQVVIFLHGYTDSWFSFSSVMENLPPKYHAYSLTQRGHGDSDKPLTGYAMTDFSEDVVAFMDHFGIQKAAVVGHSMGSVIAQRVAIDYPERVKKLVLIGSTPDVTTNEMLQGFLEYVYTLEDPIDPAFVYDFQASTAYTPLPEDFLNTVVNESLKVPVRVWQAALAGLNQANHLAELQLITVPTLIAWGDKDDIFLYDEQVMLFQGIANSTLLIYEDMGHGLHWEYPVRFACDLARFLH
jgi:non-heme chloroperoxidase